MSAEQAKSNTDWADDVDYGSDDDEDNDQENNEDGGWADDIDYGDDDDDSIGDLNLSSDDPELPPETGGAGGAMKNEIKYEITSGLPNPNHIGVSYELRIDTKDTPGDISDDDMGAPGLRVNHFQLITSDDGKEEMSSDSDDTLLGSGSFAKVYRARNTKNGKLVALKVMYKNLLRKQFVMKSRYNPDDDDDDPVPISQRHTMLEAVQIELGIMMKIRCVHTIRLWFVIDDPQKDSLYLSLEYSPYGQVMDFDGKLLQYIPNQRIWSQNMHSSKEKWITTNTQVPQPWWHSKYVSKSQDQEPTLRDKVERFREKVAKKLFMDCVKGIEYLHDLNIIHRDLKPENLLLFKDDQHESGLMVKIADFGTAEQFESKEEAYLVDTQGTFHFMSPSACTGDKRNAFYDDVWALGVVLYAFIFGTVPFFHPLDYQLFESIQNDPLVLPDDEALPASEQVRDLITQILTKRDEDRIRLTEIENHEWYDGYIHPEYVMEEEEIEEDLNLTELPSTDDCTCCIIL